MLNVGVMVSGGGTNLQAVIDAIESGAITNAKIRAVISNNPGAYALERAKKHGIEAVCVSPKSFKNREEFHGALLEKVDSYELDFEDNAAVCVVLASDGYPEHYEKGYPILGLETFKEKDGYYVFHAGSKFDGDGRIVTNGGRVLGVTALGRDLKEARKNAYEATDWIRFENKYMRKDIGKAIDEA